MAIEDYKRELVDLCESTGILKFGSFELKSKRISPYFLNCGLFLESSKALRSISQAYAATLLNHIKTNPDFKLDVLFGPAYKGIPFASTTLTELNHLDPKLEIAASFNRKEAKDHGEGGVLVGASLRDKRVVVIDDVVTAGTAIREAISIIRAQGGTLVGILVAIDRQEKVTGASEREGKGDDGSARPSAIQEVQREFGVPVLSVLTTDDLIAAMKANGRDDEVRLMEEYRKQYRATDVA